MVMGDFILDSELFAFQFDQTKIIRMRPLAFFVNRPFEGGMFHKQ